MTYYPDRDFIGSPRKTWRVAMLDDYVPGTVFVEEAFETDENPNLVSSLCEDGLHRPALDIDLPFNRESIALILSTCDSFAVSGVIVVPSSSGHCHVYATRPALGFIDYVELVDRFVAAGLVERNYLSASIAREQTRLRLPGVKKQEIPV